MLTRLAKLLCCWFQRRKPWIRFKPGTNVHLFELQMIVPILGVYLCEIFVYETPYKGVIFTLLYDNSSFFKKKKGKHFFVTEFSYIILLVSLIYIRM